MKLVERKKGKWIITDEDRHIWHCKCPECGRDPQYFISGSEDWWMNDLPNFCPYCGADMRDDRPVDEVFNELSYGQKNAVLNIINYVVNERTDAEKEKKQ